MQKVYLETSFISYLVARPSSDLIVATRQRLTNDWWESERPKFTLYASALVLQEAQRGDASEITKRMVKLDGIPLLQTTAEALRLANELVQRGALPAKAMADAVHIAVATVHQMDYLLSWNCKHIANAHVRRMADRIFRAAGYEPTVICTPEELEDLI